MDYSLGAVKVLIAQLQAAQEVPRTGGVTMSLGSLLFQRAWLQVRSFFFLFGVY
jgi:hypothetical protein